MIRLNTWQQETLPSTKETSRISDAIPHHHEVHELPEMSKDHRFMNVGTDDVSELSKVATKLAKKQPVQELQFWADFQAYLKGSTPERCLFVKTLAPSRSLTSFLIIVDVLDEFEAPSKLYLSLQWMRQQAAKADRPVHLALQGRSMDQLLATGDMIALYDYVRSGDCIIADKFHF